MTKAELTEFCGYLQYLLGLQHWKVKISLKGPDEFLDAGLAGSQGCCFVHSRLLEADIWLLDPKRIGNEKFRKLIDLKSTLIHELIHIHFEQLNIPEESEVQYEQVVISLERAFMTLLGEGNDSSDDN